MPDRAAFYVDGFNVYHALDRLNRPYLKWLDWQALARRLIPQNSETLTGVTFCTAIVTADPGKQTRHRAYVAALQACGVVCRFGHFAREKRICKSCGARWETPVEKQGDVNLAVAIIDDAYQDTFEHCYLVTADGDQVATVRALKQRFPGKKLTTVVVTGSSHNKMIFSAADAKITISVEQLEWALLPEIINGPAPIRRPLEYDPPIDWRHPANRA
jgi:hypothetical protein